MAHAKMYKTFEDLGELLHLPEGYKIVAAQSDGVFSGIMLLVVSDKIEETQSGRVPNMDIQYSYEIPADYKRIIPEVRIV